MGVDRLTDDIAHAQARVQARIRVLKHHLGFAAQRLQSPLRQRRDVLAIEADRSGGRVDQPEDQTPDRTLAGARFTHKAQHFARSHRENWHPPRRGADEVRVRNVLSVPPPREAAFRSQERLPPAQTPRASIRIGLKLDCTMLANFECVSAARCKSTTVAHLADGAGNGLNHAATVRAAFAPERAGSSATPSCRGGAVRGTTLRRSCFPPPLRHTSP